MNSPLLWNLRLDGATGGRSSLMANAVVGAAFFAGPNLRYFDKFITVGRERAWAFDVNVVLTIVDLSNDSQRKLRLPLSQLRLEAYNGTEPVI